MSKERLGILASGNGTTAEYVYHSLKNGEVDMELSCIVTDRDNAGVIQRMVNAGFGKENIVIVERKKFRGGDNSIDEEGFGKAINVEFDKRGVTVVTQNGFTVHTPDVVIDHYQDMIFNQHPGSLPDFAGIYGRQVHAATLLFKRRTEEEMWTESVFHRVHSEVDAGPVVKSRKVDIKKGDSVDDLRDRVLPVEHELAIELLRDVLRGSIKEECRESTLKPGQEVILEQSKKMARLLYPRG